MEPPTIPPDGGWGWMVVLGAALINMVNQALFSLFGLVFGEHLKAMAHGKATGITLVMAISVMVTNFSGLAVGPMMRKFSVRTIAIFGILCVGTGMIISSFSSEIWHIVIGYGFFTGLGLGLLASVTFLAINNYFTKKKSTAVGLSMAGTSVGQMIMPTFVGILLKKYDFSGTTLILGIMSYTGIIGALLFEPLFNCRAEPPPERIFVVENGGNFKSEFDVNFNDDHKEVKPEENLKEPEKKILLNEKSKLPKKESNGIISTSIKTSYNASAVEITNSTELANGDEKSGTCFGKIVKSLDLTLLTDFTFVHILIGLSLGYVSTVTFSTFFPMFLQDEVDFSMMETTSCMTALSFADIVGRATVSEICRRLNLGSKSAFMMGCILLAICRACMVSLSDFKLVLTASLLVGYFRAATVINQNLVISEYIEKEKLPSAVGLNMVSKGLFVLTLGQALGLMKDLLNYALCIQILNLILIIVVVSWTMEKLIRARYYT